MSPRFNDTSSECAPYLRKLDPYVDGELSPGHEADVAAHTLGCPLCQERVALTRAVRKSLRKAAFSAGRCSAPASLRSKVAVLLSEARSDGLRERDVRGGGSRPRIPLRYAVA